MVGKLKLTERMEMVELNEVSNLTNAGEVSFEEKLSKIQNLLQRLNDENLKLEDSVKLYKEGMELIKEAKEILDRAKVAIDMVDVSF